jgi:flagellar hook protein FlgE
MFTSFSTALSALNSTSTAIDVVGNNLANLNTNGYKTSVVSFHDLVTQSQGSGLGETQVGFGTAPPITMRQFTQGAVQASSGTLDAAIQGDGFFIVKDSNYNQMFTRAGEFQADANGNLLTSTKQYVQGWTAAANGVIDTTQAVSDIQIPVGQLRQPFPTDEMSVNLNLNAAAISGTPDDNFSTPMQVIDSLGNTQTLTITFTKDPATPLQWNYQVTIPGNATTAGTPGTPTPLLATPGTVTFDPSGQLVSPSAAAGGVPIAITGLSDSALDMNITWNLYNPDGSTRVTQLSQPSAVSANEQNGQPAAQLLKVAMGEGGQVLAQYSNGTQAVVAQLALASVRNPQSLIAVGNNNYQASTKTAMPAIGTATTGGRGQIVGGSLESSTVDIAQQFTQLITFQRAYEANSKIVTTADSLSQTTINLMR